MCTHLQIHTVSFSADGKRLASGSADQMIKIWRVDDQSISVRRGAAPRCQRVGGRRRASPRLTAPAAAALQSKAEVELRAPYAVTAVAWHPTHPDRLASLCDDEKAVRCEAGAAGRRRWEAALVEQSPPPPAGGRGRHAYGTAAPPPLLLRQVLGRAVGQEHRHGEHAGREPLPGMEPRRAPGCGGEQGRRRVAAGHAEDEDRGQAQLQVPGASRGGGGGWAEALGGGEAGPGWLQLCSMAWARRALGGALTFVLLRGKLCPAGQTKLRGGASAPRCPGCGR